MAFIVLANNSPLTAPEMKANDLCVSSQALLPKLEFWGHETKAVSPTEVVFIAKLAVLRIYSLIPPGFLGILR